MEAQIRSRDINAKREIAANGKKRFLLRSLIAGCIVSIPMIVVGLQMTIQNMNFPLGSLLLIGGIIAMGVAIHYRIIHDNIKDANKWLNLDTNQKFHQMSVAQLGINMPQTMAQPMYTGSFDKAY